MDVMDLIRSCRPEVLAALRLQSDDYWPKMDSQEKRYYLNESMRAGEALATVFHARQERNDIHFLAEKYNIRVRKDTTELDTAYPDFSGRWRNERRTLYLHAGIAQVLLNLLQSFSIPITEADAFRFMFLRAFYSPYAEENRALPSETLKPVEVKVLFSKRSFAVKTADKVAEERFTDLVADFPVPAGLLPYLQLIGNDRTDIANVHALISGGIPYENGNRH